MIFPRIIANWKLTLYIPLIQHCVTARRIWGNSALNTVLIVHNNCSNNGIDKKKTKWKSNREVKGLERLY